jgi:hypothetical protein
VILFASLFACFWPSEKNQIRSHFDKKKPVVENRLNSLKMNLSTSSLATEETIFSVQKLATYPKFALH